MKSMRLTPAALNWLGSAFETKTKVSPLSTAQADGFDQAGLDDLVKQGVVGPDKTMTTEAYAMLEVLAGATKYASVHLSGGSGHVNRVTYWNGDKTVSLDNTGTMFTVSFGNDASALETLFTEITGSNHIVSSNFSASFDIRTALVFAGLFDLSRRAAIHLYADNTPVPAGFSAAEVGKFVKEANNARWLTSHIKSLPIKGLGATHAEAEASLKKLVAAGVIAAAKDGTYTSAYESAELAANFLFVENTVHFRAGSEQNGTLSAAECMYLQAGIHDVIMMDVAADKIDITSTSSFNMIDNIKQMMTTPVKF